MITHWDKKVGDLVKVGDILFSYETDKAAFECESTAEGEILAIFFEDGAEVPVLVNVCAIGKTGEDVSVLRPDGEKKAGDAGKGIAGTPTETMLNEPDVSSSVSVQQQNNELKISPRARNLAEKTGLDPRNAAPTGPYGRVIEQDIRTLSENGAGTGIGGKVRVEDLSAVAKPDDEGKTIPSPAANEYTDIKFSKIRSAIAQAMSTSLSTAAQLTHHHSFDATNILALRKSLKENAERLRLPNITLNDFILFAVSRTLLNHPDLNAHIVEGNVLRRFKDVHLGVAIDTPRGLMVPVIFYANRKSLSEIAVEAKELAKQAQAGTINPDLLQGGTFTVSNLGALGVEMFTPVLNPPQTGILGVCNIINRLKEAGGEYKPYPAMGLSITYDHRAIDGAPEARFAQELISNLENFSILLVK
jgi:pyruvate dehydrogenase E2 component (dihydrolipoamide acetyltransferase)